MCLVKDEVVDPHEGHAPNVEPGRDDNRASIDTLIKQLKYFWFVLIPITAWVARVEGFVRVGDRQTSAMSLQQHADMTLAFEKKIDQLPPQLYRDYIDAQFALLHERLDHIETLMEKR